MALTKVRPPVTDISLLSNGTTQINIPTAGADVDVNVAGANVIDLGSTAITIDDLVTLVVQNVLSEIVTLETAAGAEGVVQTDATKMQIGATTLDPLEIITNNIARLTVASSGAVVLGVQGANPTELIDKAYVDGAAPAASVALADLVVVNATTGSAVIPNSTGNDLIFNWGINPSVLNNSNTVVTFNQAYTSAFFVGFAQPTTSDNHDGTMEVFANSLTTMTIHSSLDHSSAFNWFSIGF